MSTDHDTPQHGASFSMPFPINVDNLFAFKDQCAQSSGALRTADGDTMRASSIVGQQEALCVQPCQYDLQVASDVCEGISNDLKELTNAVSELAWSMRSVRDEWSSPVEWCNRFVSFGVGYALSWSGGSSCPVGWGVSRDLVRMSRLR